MNSALGALFSGLGSGMTHFAGLLHEKKKQDWDSKRDNILYNRKKELERVRRANNLYLEKQRYKNNLDILGKRQDNALKVAEFNARRSDERQDRADRKASNRLDLQNKRAIELINTRNMSDLGKQLALSRASVELSQSQRLENLKSIKNTEYWNNLSEDQKSKVEVSLLHPEVTAILAPSKDPTAKVKLEQFSRNYAKGWESWSLEDESIKKALIKEYGNELNARSEYANMIAAESINLTGDIDSQDSVYKNQMKIARDLKSGKVTVEEVINKLSDNPNYSAFVLSLIKEQKDDEKKKKTAKGNKTSKRKKVDKKEREDSSYDDYIKASVFNRGADSDEGSNLLSLLAPRISKDLERNRAYRKRRSMLKGMENMTEF